MTTSWRIERWIDERSWASIVYADYWNDAEAERDKVWDVTDGSGFSDVEADLREVGLEQDLRRCLTHLAANGASRPLHGREIDVAAGTLWAVPVLLPQPVVDLEIGPQMLEPYGVDSADVTLALGPPECSLDFAFLPQARHHAARPDALLHELNRVLADDGAYRRHVDQAGFDMVRLESSEDFQSFVLRKCGSPARARREPLS